MKINILFILLISFFIIQCEKNLVVPIEQNDKSEKLGKINLNLQGAPIEVKYLDGYLSRSGFDSIYFDFYIQNEGANAQVDNISVGEWQLVVNAYNDSARVIYSGETIVNILPGTTVNVSLHLKPTSGSLEITVTWGDQETLVFYSLESKTYLINGPDNSPSAFADGAYPFWIDSKSKIGFHSTDNYTFYVIDATTKSTLKSYDITGYGTFTLGRYSQILEKFLFAVNQHGHPSIALMDNLGEIEIISLEYPIYNPVTCGVDDWIYFLRNTDGTRDVSRMKPDGSFIEILTDSEDYLYSNFSVSYDGNFIAVPKWNDNYHFIAIIDTKTKQERLIDLTDLNLVGYTSFSKDNKYIYFTGGDNRDLYQINLDGSDLKPLSITAQNFYRPLSW